MKGNRRRAGFHRALNVAEKPSVAKGATQILSKGNFQRRATKSQYNPVFQFDYELDDGTNYDMVFTSVRGHIMHYEFGGNNTRWDLATNKDLYSADILHMYNPKIEDLKSNIESAVRDYSIDTLILWLDCDREGENIAFEVIELVTKVKPNVNILRAHFSALTQRDMQNAMNNLTPPDQNLSDAVDIRQKIDLLIGASFTRMQTLSFRDIFFPNASREQKTIISYGPCQFPTMNFVIERAEKILNFVEESFYYLEIKIGKQDQSGKEIIVTFNWETGRLYDVQASIGILEKLLHTKTCIITKVKKAPRTRYRPIPLNTVEMQKLISRKLRINSHEAMDIAEKLYQKGLISYPRTETQKYTGSQYGEIRRVVEAFQDSPTMGDYCRRLLDDSNGAARYKNPRQGKGDDKAHPPIHPVKFDDGSNLNAKEKKVYEFISRHFLGSVSPDATGTATTAELECAEEEFKATGLVINDPGYLEIYTYDKWSDNYLPEFVEGEVFQNPKEIKLSEGRTSPPNFLTESELIALMDKNGIGTDATIAEHIKTVQERKYVVQDRNYFKPTLVGCALRDAYKAMKIDIYKPYLRAQMEKDITEVANGQKDKDNVLNEMKHEMERIFDSVNANLGNMATFIRKYLADHPNFESDLNKYRGNGGGRGGGGNFGGNNDGGNNDGFDDDGGNNDFGGGAGDDGDDYGGGKGKKKGRGKGKKKGKGKGKKRGKKKKNADDENDDNSGNDASKVGNKGGWIKKKKYDDDGDNNNFIRNCPKCGNPMRLVKNRSNDQYFIGCQGYPGCKQSFSIGNPTYCEISDKQCDNCSSDGNQIMMYEIGKNGEEHDFICLYNCLKNSIRKDGGNGNFNNKNYGKKKTKTYDDFENDDMGFKKVTDRQVQKKTYNKGNKKKKGVPKESTDDFDNIDLDGLDKLFDI